MTYLYHNKTSRYHGISKFQSTYNSDTAGCKVIYDEEKTHQTSDAFQSIYAAFSQNNNHFGFRCAPFRKSYIHLPLKSTKMKPNKKTITLKLAKCQFHVHSM